MPSRAPLRTTLEPRLKRYLDQRVRTGEFASLDAALDASVQSLKDREKQERANSRRLSKEIAIGTAQADRGELIDADVVFREIRTRSARRRRKSG